MNFIRLNGARRNNGEVSTERALPELKHERITGLLKEAFYRVYGVLGYGFLEGVYANAMMIECRKAGLNVRHEVRIRVNYEGVDVGHYDADLVVGDAVIVELKACRTLAPEHEAQLLNYLKATAYEVGFLFNFGPKPQYRRMVYDNSRKGSLSWLSKDAEGRRLTPKHAEKEYQKS